MNKIQYIKLLNLRGITDLDGCSVAEAVKLSGGNPTTKEMVAVNEYAMEYYLNKYLKLLKDYESIKEENAKYIDDSVFLDALKAAGVDNWSGYENAHKLMEEWQENG